MKLNKRQTRIILVFFSVAVLVVAPVSFLIFQKKETKETSFTKTDSLAYEKEQAIARTNLIKANTIKDEVLLQKLKNNLLIRDAKETNWTNYLNLAQELSELKAREQTLLRIIEEIKSPPLPNPVPIPPPLPLPTPSPTPPPPSPFPTPPNDKWEKVLNEIHDFVVANTDPIIQQNEKNGISSEDKIKQTLKRIKDWVVNKKNEYGNPLSGIKLDAKETTKKLKNLAPYYKQVELLKGTKWENYIALTAVGDGNCFLNSFSTLLTGNIGDTSLNFPLRVAMCLEIMHDPWRYENDYYNQIKYIKRVIVDEGISTNRSWLENLHVIHLCSLLKRPVSFTSIAPGFLDEKGKQSINYYEYPLAIKESFEKSETPEKGEEEVKKLKLDIKYSEPFAIYNSGGHFVPLIKP